MTLQHWPQRLASKARPFSGLPAPATVYGEIRLASDIGPAPGVELISNGSIWRPRGGAQGLAVSDLPVPITVQNTAGDHALILGPFPGGMIRRGHRLDVDVGVNLPALSAAVRAARVYVDNTNPPVQLLTGTTASLTVSSLAGRYSGFLSAVSDGGAAHTAGINSAASFSSVAGTILTPSVDFSLPWYLSFWMQSVNENSKTISGATWAAGVATYTCTGHTLSTGDKTTVAGITPAGYNVVGTVTVLNANTFTIAVAADPGAYTSGGTSSRISNCNLMSYLVTWSG